MSIYLPISREDGQTYLNLLLRNAIFQELIFLVWLRTKKNIGPSSGATIGETGKGKLLLVGRRRKKKSKEEADETEWGLCVLHDG